MYRPQSILHRVGEFLIPRCAWCRLGSETNFEKVTSALLAGWKCRHWKVVPPVHEANIDTTSDTTWDATRRNIGQP
jgi:hypothetical protein